MLEVKRVVGWLERINVGWEESCDEEAGATAVCVHKVVVK